MSSFAAKMKLKAAKAAELAKKGAASAQRRASEIDKKHNVVAKTKTGAASAAANVSAAASKAKTKVNGIMTEEQQQQAMVAATLGLTAMSVVGVPGSGAALTGMALAGTASSMQKQRKAQGGSLTNDQMLMGAMGVGGAVGGAKTRMAMGVANVGMQAKQTQKGGSVSGNGFASSSSGGGGGGGGGGVGGMLQQAKDAKKMMDFGKSLGITPQQALKGAQMANKAGLLK